MPPEASPQEPPVSQSGLSVKVASIIVAVVLIGVAIFFVIRQSPMLQEAGIFPQGAKVFATVGFVQVTALHEVREGAFSYVKVPGMPEGTFVTDVVFAGDTAYYFLIAPDRSSVGLYRLSKEGTLAELPTAKTMKFDLFFDEETGALVYLSGETSPEEYLSKSDWALTSYDPATAGETFYAVTGTRVAPLSKGVSLVRSGGTLVAVDLQQGTEETILSIHPQAPFAVSRDGARLALYNVVTASVDIFDLSKGASMPSYASSHKLEMVPTALAFSGVELFASWQTEAQTLRIGKVGGGEASFASPHPEVPMAVQKLTIIP